MSYTNRVEEMVAFQVAQYQAEQELAKLIQSQPKTIPMPHGYPRSVYHPHRYLATPQARAFIARSGGMLNNGVPKVLSMDVIQGYTLGTYNPRTL